MCLEICKSFLMVVSLFFGRNLNVSDIFSNKNEDLLIVFVSVSCSNAFVCCKLIYYTKLNTIDDGDDVIFVLVFVVVLVILSLVG